MTCDNFHPRFQEPAGLPPLTRSYTGRTRIPNNPVESVAKDTIHLHDSAFALPHRSLTRRRAFEDLQYRYYRQILYGCSNPYCKTPTCLSCRRRVSKGPFRPYTVLSARTLASHLASEDHPEKGLCPYPPKKFETPTGSIGKEIQYNRKVSGSPVKSSGNLKHVVNAVASCDGTVKTPIAQVNARIGAGSGQQTATKLGQDPAGNESAENARHKSSKDDQVRKAKDTKSFAQSLFDTVSMKLLYLAHLSEDQTRWLWSQNIFPPDNKVMKANQSTDTKDRGGVGGDDLATTGQSKTETQDAITRKEITKQHSTRLPLHRDGIGQDPGPVSPDSSYIMSTMSPRAVSMGSNSTNTFQSDQGGRTSAPAPDTLGKTPEKSVTTGHSLPRSTSGGEELSVAKVNLDPLSREGEGCDSRNSPSDPNCTVLPPPQSLSHLSSANIKGLMETLVHNHSALFDEHRLLRSRGRTESPLCSSTCSPGEAESYRRFLTFSTQSITFVLSNTEALMRSFLRCSVDNESRMISQSDDFPIMVSSFRSLRALDFHPSSIFPSLWISVSHIHPFSVNRRKISIIKAGLSSLDDPHEPLDDVEASHIAKLTFAALVASVPKYSVATMSAVIKLRSSGKIAPLDGINDPPRYRVLVKKVLSAVFVFENEMALSVVKRLAMVIAARHYGSRSSRNWGRTVSKDGDFFGHLIYYLVAGDFKMCLPENSGCPSLSDGKLISQNRARPVENLDIPLLVTIGWLQALILKEWDGRPRILKCSAVGAAVELLRQIFMCPSLESEEVTYQIPFLSQRLDLMEVPMDWAASDEDKSFIHLLSYPFLFPISVRVSYFRAINYDAMYKAYEGATSAQNLTTKMTFTDSPTHRGAIRLTEGLRRAQNSYLVLEIRREDVLTDAMDQLWRRRKCELMRPLRVRMGMGEGEEGIDHGGVQQEFFRIAVAEALDPKYGAFTTDPQIHMSWFQVRSLEPLYKFELLGLLASIAVYNGLTLPFSFPIAFYRNLLGFPNSRIADIQDGWPELAKGLRELRDWPDDNVEEVFVRQYVFSVDAFGSIINVDMDKANKCWSRPKRRPQRRDPRKENGKGIFSATGYAAKAEGSMQDQTSQYIKLSDDSETDVPKSASEHGQDSCSDSRTCSSDEDEARSRPVLTRSILESGRKQGSEPIMVTNENREAYIFDYISHLTNYAISDQKKAFEDGFFTCISRKSISLFSATQLKYLVEGLPHVEVRLLERVAKYEGGFHPGHPTVRLFWAVVRRWSQEKVRQLLEFVTASDRLPAGGIQRITFVIQKNGMGDGGRLPTSSTCFGRLLLPEYHSEDMLRRGLELAVENSKGFGQP